MSTSTETILFPCPLFALWLYHSHQILFTTLNLQSSLTASPPSHSPSSLQLSLFGPQPSLTQITQHLNILCNKFRVTLIQSPRTAVLLKHYGKGDLLQITDSISQDMLRLQIKIRGVYLFAYPRGLREELEEIGVWRQMVRRVVLGVEEVLLVGLMDAVGEGRREGWQVEVQSYGVYFAGEGEGMERGSEFVIGVVLGYGVHYVYYEEEGGRGDGEGEGKKMVRRIRERFGNRKVRCFERETIRKLCERLLLLQNYYSSIDKNGGNFLAVVCQNSSSHLIEDIRMQVKQYFKESKSTPLSPECTPISSLPSTPSQPSPTNNNLQFLGQPKQNQNICNPPSQPKTITKLFSPGKNKGRAGEKPPTNILQRSEMLIGESSCGLDLSKISVKNEQGIGEELEDLAGFQEEQERSRQWIKREEDKNDGGNGRKREGRRRRRNRYYLKKPQ